ncbi:MAG: sugar transferase [Candidatus Zixiibacteriota bacterium]
MAKRAFDLVVSVVGLIILSPIFLIAALFVKLSGPGPVFFRQVRVGRGFRHFRIYKFRTMVDGASGPPITVRGDPRVTPVGRFLRRTKLDELPQLLNVISGRMSLVGPRPELPQYVDAFRDDYTEILRVRPGITDEASIAFRDEEELLSRASDPQEMYVTEILPRKIALARHYARKRTFFGDLGIIARTIFHL